MSGEKEKKSINWSAIFLAFVVATVGNYMWSSANGDSDQGNRSVPEGIKTTAQLGIDGGTVQIDSLADGRIMVDGEVKTLDEFNALVPQWKISRKMASFYYEPRPEGVSSQPDAASDAILKGGLTISPRREPQNPKPAGSKDPSTRSGIK